MKPYDTMCQIRHQQVFHAANNNVNAGQLVVGAGGSALAVPDDPLGSVLQSFRTENGFDVDTGGCGCAWFRDFRDGDVDMSTYNAVDYLEMLLDLPDAAVSGAEATEAPAPARAEAVVVPDRPVVMSRSPLSSSSDSSSSSDDDDDPWLPAKSNKRGGTKRRRQQQQRPPAGQMKQQPVSTARQAPSSVAVAVEGGVGSGNERWCRHCGTAETTLWRAGPEGPKTLCNACGLRHKNKSAAPTTKRRPATKPSGAKSKNYSVMPLVGDEKVARKERSMVICID